MLCELSDFPTRKASKAILSVNKKVNILDVFIEYITSFFIENFNIYIPINEKLFDILKITSIHMKPESYIIKPLIIFFFLMFSIIPLIYSNIFLFFILTLFFVVIIICYYFYPYKLYNLHRKFVLMEIDKLLQAILQYTEEKTDIKEFFKLYSIISNKEMKLEINKLLEGNLELKAFEIINARIKDKDFCNIMQAVQLIINNDIDSGRDYLKAFLSQKEEINYKYFRKNLRHSLNKYRLCFFFMFILSAVFYFYIIKISYF